MKISSIVLLSLIALTAFGQTQEPAFDGHEWKAPYTLNVPKDWGVERFLIPISFAPQIPYHGVEDIRFMPGWSKANSNEYWTYAFLWYVDNMQKTNAKIIETNLKAYYTGLIEVNSGQTGQAILVKAKFKKVKTAQGDSKTFRGTISMLDYMAKKTILLHCIVHLKFSSKQDKTFLFYEISPKQYDDKVWQSLHQLWTDLKNE
jgi:hypothetical protein